MRTSNCSSKWMHQGHTLFELMVTLLTLSMLCSLALPGMNHLIKQAQSRASINRISSAVQEVRHLALSKRRIMTLCPSRNTKHCDGDWSGNLIILQGQPDESSTVVSHFSAQSRGHLSWRSFRQDNFLQMQGGGLTFAQNGTFTYCPEDGNLRYAHALIVNKSGRIRLAEDMDGDGIRDISKGNPVSCQ